MTRLCLDTSAYSHFMRGHPPCVAAVNGATEVLLPVIVLGELRVGFRLGKALEKNERALAAFLASDPVEVIHIDEQVASTYAELVVELRRAGTPVPTNDIWIAASAICEGATVLTYDEHFQRITRAGTSLLHP